MSLETRFYSSYPTEVVDGSIRPKLGAVTIVHPEGFKNQQPGQNLQLRLESSKFADLPAGYVQV